MKRYSIILSLTLSLFLMASCQSTTRATILPSLETPPLSYPTVSSTLSPSQQVHQTTKTATRITRPQSQSPIQTITPSPDITVTAAPDELPFPPRPDFSGPASAYQLNNPTPEELLTIMDFARQQLMLIYGINSYGERDENLSRRWGWLLSSAIWQEMSAFSGAVDATYLKAYPVTLPDPTILLKDPYPIWWIKYPFIKPHPQRYIVDAFLTHIYQTGARLEAGQSINISSFTLEPFPAELDGTLGQEWITFLWTPAMDHRYNGFGLWQAVDELPDQKYIPLGEPIIGQALLMPSTYQVRDLTGDGRTDLVVMGEAAGAGMAREDLIVYKWTSTDFRELSNISHIQDMWAERVDNDPYILFIPEDPPALRISSDVIYTWGCAYQTIEVYRWVGGSEQRAETNTMDPNSPTCLLARATQRFSSDRIETTSALHLLERALTGLNSQTLEDQAKISFAHYHLALLEAIRGNDAAARTHLRIVMQSFANDTATSQYLKESLIPLLTEPKLKAIDICSIGYNAPETVFSTWRSGTDNDSYIGLQPGKICSSNSTVDRFIKYLPIFMKEPPEQLLN